MSASSINIKLPEITDDDIRWACSLLGLPINAFHGESGQDGRRDVLLSMESLDVAACPGSGKTTLLVAKLAILAKKWSYKTQGICVLSHTNVARDEIETRIGNTPIGRSLLSYPHYIGTIHSFLNEFLALPWLKAKGYPVKVIDTDICIEKRTNLLPPNIRSNLKNNKSRSYKNWLYITNPDFLPQCDGMPSSSTQTYKEIIKSCKKSVEMGYFCYDEMIMWANDLIVRKPSVIQSVRDRFCILFIDEAQDTKEIQSSILYKIFTEGSSNCVRQRLGDENQAIFDETESSGAETDKFPIISIKKDLQNSYRFGPKIADFAQPLGIVPQDIKGIGPSKKSISRDFEAQHAIFLFNEASISKVLDEYGKLLLQTFTNDELEAGIFTAIGHRHRPPEEDKKQTPYDISYYWLNYEPKLTNQSIKPTSFVQYIIAGVAAAKTGKESYLCINKIIEGIVFLLNIAESELNHFYKKLNHQKIIALLANNPAALNDYEELINEFAFRKATITKETWGNVWRSIVERVTKAILNVSQLNQGANTFLFWDEQKINSTGGLKNSSNNLYRYPTSEPKVNIRIGSIHSIKGQTHSATLVVETFWNAYNIESLLPWLSAGKIPRTIGSQQKSRLKLHYVAMTRPTHLLCLAMKEEAFLEKNELLLKLEQRGWVIKKI